MRPAPLSARAFVGLRAAIRLSGRAACFRDLPDIAVNTQDRLAVGFLRTIVFSIAHMIPPGASLYSSLCLFCNQ